MRRGIPFAQPGYADPSLPEVGISSFPNPMNAAAWFQGSTAPEQQNALDLWQVAGINRIKALAQVFGVTPGFRNNPVSALSYG